jgi:hypothetical protein
LLLEEDSEGVMKLELVVVMVVLVVVPVVTIADRLV